MIEDKYIEDIKEIKGIILKSIRFISVSGLSGIIVGLIALSGVFFANKFVYSNLPAIGFERIENHSEIRNNLLLIALSTIVFVILTVFYLTSRVLRKHNEKAWNHHISRLLISLTIPLVSGGVLCLIFLFEGYL
jgi:hypothetical protein